eukprot:377792_1
MQLIHNMHAADGDFTLQSPSNALQDNALVSVMTKNTLLAILSIGCTFCVSCMLFILSMHHQGIHQHHPVLEEFILEFFILIDIVSNVLCVLLSYRSFNTQYGRFCTVCNDRVDKCFHLEITRRISQRNMLQIEAHA